MTSAIERLAELVIGSVESVAPGEIRIQLELEAPHTTALNTGTPSSFPRLNSYVVIPNEAGATVAYVHWIGIERSPYPKRAGLKDFGLIDLPFPLRKMWVAPVGTLRSRRDSASGTVKYELSRGVSAFPSVGDQVLIPTPEQIDAIVGGKDSEKRVRIGASPLAADAAIKVDPDKLFGRHLAVLGNTGSGKSCSVAGLIRWSLEASKREIGGENPTPNARFIVLDPNGEYSKAFDDLGGQTRVFRVPPVADDVRPLDVPAWLWSGHEWTAVAHAQPGAQRPLLMQELRELKDGNIHGVPREAIVRRYLGSYVIRIVALLNQGAPAFSGSVPARFSAARLLEGIRDDTLAFVDDMDVAYHDALREISVAASQVLDDRSSGNGYFNDFSFDDLEGVRDQIQALIRDLPEAVELMGTSEDSPTYFDVNQLPAHLEQIATEQGGNLAAFISTLGLRIKSMLADQRLGPVISRDPPTTFENWLKDYVGDDGASNGPLAVIDLSLVPAEVVHIVVAVTARLIFEALQRYRRAHPEGKPLPTVLVLEEAHSFIKKGGDIDALSPSHLCRETFERIAREGRKFGLGLVLSSQRPSELSPTVLAQCNTFLLHRLVNDADQGLVSKLVPDNVGGLLKELPSLPSRQAILLGWATPIPILVEIDELPDAHQPQSKDPDFWDVWTQKSPRDLNWQDVIAEWMPAHPGAEPPIADGGDGPAEPDAPDPLLNILGD
jgi:hypothetical protein